MEVGIEKYSLLESNSAGYSKKLQKVYFLSPSKLISRNLIQGNTRNVDKDLKTSLFIIVLFIRARNQV